MTSRTRSPRTRIAVDRPGDAIVAIDVETTGLDPASDRIIEVAAVKFRGRETLAEFSSLVNPEREVPPFIVGLTGITQAETDAAPRFADIAPKLHDLLGTSAVVGHNVGFDLGFFRSHGVPVRAAAYDTFDLAFVLLTDETEYGLEQLAARFGLRQGRAHRALSDAQATRDLFVLLHERLSRVDPAVLNRLQALSPSPDWPVGALARQILSGMPDWRVASSAGPLGLDIAAVTRRARPVWGSRAKKAGPADRAAFATAVQSAFQTGGQLESQLPGYERRPEQEEMASAVAAAIGGEGHAVIEAGTGVGKSLAYLVPAALHAASGGGAVIVTTNTINLQEQLLGKDMPVARSVVEKLGIKVDEVRSAQLKGRANYLCFKKWAHAAQSSAPTDQDARVIAKCLLWLQHTETGDRAEIGLSRDAAAFTRLSAQGAAGCPSADGPCFLRKARADAAGADIVVINHSLLLSDVVMGGGLLPSHDTLIIDEAQHLEPVATRHLGFQVVESQLAAELATLQATGGGRTAQGRGLIFELARVCQALDRERALNPAPAAAAAAVAASTRALDRAGTFYSAVRKLARDEAQPGEEGADLRITPGTRAQPGWGELQVAWENLDSPLAELAQAIRALISEAERGSPLDEDAQAVVLNATTSLETIGLARQGLRQAVFEPAEETVYWVSSADRGAWTAINGAPLRVGPLLKEKIFDRERCVVLTGATLSDPAGAQAGLQSGGPSREVADSDGDDGESSSPGTSHFSRMRSAVGLEGGRELVLGSPFDYRSAALIVIPEDIPEPGAPGYAKAVAAAVTEIALALRERVLVLFTSNSALENARKAVSAPLQAAGIRVLAQGTDGSPHRVMRALADTRAAVAMGAQSLWEGVDLGGQARRADDASRNTVGGASIKALLMARLPFPVPNEPIVAARSELYEDGFNEYMVPEAVMRFRQGFGRLIRSRSDRGAFVVLDRRILTKRYGLAFQKSLPRCTVRRVPLAELGDTVRRWNTGEEP